MREILRIVACRHIHDLQSFIVNFISPALFYQILIMFSRICSKRTLGFSANRSIQHAIFIPRRQYAKMVDDKNNTQYFLAADPKEAERLKLNQEVIRDYMKGKLVEANLDLNKPGLRILDSATASGKYMLAVYFATLPTSTASALANHVCFCLFRSMASRSKEQPG